VHVLMSDCVNTVLDCVLPICSHWLRLSLHKSIHANIALVAYTMYGKLIGV
jgi:hypothetical protein